MNKVFKVIWNKATQR
ncbi:ESPR-type extended signal peptide-containing protein, partial [Haemophilus influenzae]